MATVAILGGGKMGEALLAGLLKVGHEAVVAEPNDERAAYLAEVYGVRVTTAPEAVADAEAVIVAVKPAQVAGLLADASASIPPAALVISVAAGITTAGLLAALDRPLAVVRAMPNTPALIGEGMTVLSAGTTCDDDQLAQALDLLATVGRVAVVAEDQQDAVTALSGSGPAYLFFVVEAMVEAAVALGLEPRLAHELAVQTAYGASAMMRQTGEDPVVLRNNVTSPGGTTAAALEQIELHQVRLAFAAALAAARNRSAELAGS